MDVERNAKSHVLCHESYLRKNGCAQVESCCLGFQEGAIGYIPTDHQSLDLVKNRALSEISKLMDGYNMDISKKDNIHVGYVSSYGFLTSMMNFIINTLTETLNESARSHYIICLRAAKIEPVAEKLKKSLEEKNKDKWHDGTALFKEARISILDTKSCKTKELTGSKGKGKREVNIILSDSLPRNIFLDLIYLSRSGMMSGDQSLSEYISLKQEMPYLDQQPWKEPMVDALYRMVERKDLKEKIEKRISGSCSHHSFLDALSPAHSETVKLSPQGESEWQKFNEKLSARRADAYIRKLFKDQTMLSAALSDKAPGMASAPV